MVDQEILSEWFRQLALVAQRSPDLSTQNAAAYIISSQSAGLVFASENRPIVPYDETLYFTNRDYRLAITAHAEERAADACRKDKGCPYNQMVALWAACTGCARDIVLSGVTRLYRLSEEHLPPPDRWLKELHAADDILSEAGVHVIDVTLTKKIGASWRWNGKDVDI